ncbi:MAG: sigma-54-dependent Fis family transcriptional regulator, partial [Acidobacteria bacterium]|nr:sigma-54-dependent Fis family transcriptional regulator [Acidobacteriota bacterium]
MAVLRRFERLDAAPEPALDSITALVAWFFNAPISAIGLILHGHIIVKSLYGSEKAQTARRPEWCAAAITTDDVFCITNALEDPRAKADPLVVGEFGLRFYAAAPLRTREGHSLGTLSVIDRKPRDISVSEKEFLRRMASLVVDLIESRLIVNRLSALIASLANEAPRFASLAADEQLLQVLAENLAQALDVAYVFIGAPGEHGAGLPATVAFYAAGTVIGQEQDYYRATNWPYVPLLQADQNEIYYPSKAQGQFPHERRMADLQIESYAGIKLTDSALRGFGAIAILDTKPIEDLGLMRSALAAFAVLALAELKRRRAPSVGWYQPETSAGRFNIGFNYSLIGKSKRQQLAWLSDRVTGDSPAIQKARELLRLAIIKQADSVLFMGETGTGKGVCALAIHEGSGARGRFIEVNCAALPRELIESELFGHEKGSFTGATGRKIGLFEQAEGGTILLDEIAELPPDLQVKLLSVLQRRELRRVGGAQAIPINVRVIAATNRLLEIALNDGTFRHDLFFRIGSWRIDLPPLRNRGDDVILLARHFIAELVKSEGYRVEGLAPEAEGLLKQYDWPGNVRQLLNVIRRAIILKSGNVLSPETIHNTLEEDKRLFNPDRPTAPTAPRPPYKDLKRILITEAEARAITEALARNRNNKTKTANELGLTRSQLDYRLKLL